MNGYICDNVGDITGGLPAVCRLDGNSATIDKI